MTYTSSTNTKKSTKSRLTTQPKHQVEDDEDDDINDSDLSSSQSKKMYEEMTEELQSVEMDSDMKELFPSYDIKDLDSPYYKEKQKRHAETMKKKSEVIKSYKATYRDNTGPTECTVHLRGDKICLQLGDAWEFIGSDFSTLQLPTEKLLLAQTAKIFRLKSDGSLNDFSLIINVPIEINVVNEPDKSKADINTFMQIQVVIDSRNKNVQRFRFLLNFQNQTLQSSIEKTFHECLKQIQTQLPTTYVIKGCWGCAWSTYSPFGSSTVGGLGCFRNQHDMKNRKDPQNLLNIWSKRYTEVPEV
eukprot:TRINITY_DN5944_c0_g1_i1.p1 TRINITY_DN5944_c0_g1~~TRINITY_DN5944_c0_g1_i1.p1  ORF type:complete len:339 (-),score=42.59 TRINITY_DN5944_c0_g1_i1:210-1115(-)